MESKERKNLIAFFAINTILAIAGMVYYLTAEHLPDILKHIIPAYFWGIIAAYFTVFVLMDNPDHADPQIRAVKRPFLS